MDDLLDRRKFLKISLAGCAGLGALMGLPTWVAGRPPRSMSVAARFLSAGSRSTPDIRVVGVGGGGCNAVNAMIQAALEPVKFIAVDTHRRALESSRSPARLLIGPRVTGGDGARGRAEIGRAAALEDASALTAAIHGADLLLIVAGLGSGTGSGASPVIGRIAKDLGIPTVAVVTTPFPFEGERRTIEATRALSEGISPAVDVTILLPRSGIMAMADRRTTLRDVFRMADDAQVQAVTALVQLSSLPGSTGVSLTDVTKVLPRMRIARIGVGAAPAAGAPIDALHRALRSPLLDREAVENAQGVMLDFAYGHGVSLDGIAAAAEYFQGIVPLSAGAQ